MNTDSPAAVIEQIAELDDRLHEIQAYYPQKRADLMELEESYKRVRSHFMLAAPEELTVKEKEAWVRLKIAEYDNGFGHRLSDTRVLVEQLQTEYDIVSKRLSANQSILKRLEHEERRGVGQAGRPQDPGPSG